MPGCLDLVSSAPHRLRNPGEGQKTNGNEQASKREELGKLDEWPQVNGNELIETDEQG
ncbi:hypothetical protein M513_13585 [Trichuris suis]|uniref:Uncharacterized protein n=2 Tax=Trichuris suis TaxID=68888 RepID=A0A085LKP2_9BILA|nr:hypothetical protein M513_13585 [Trichuris suis]